MSKKQQLTLVAAHRQLEEQLAKGKQHPEQTPAYLPLKQIKLRPEVFQHRAPLEHTSSAHIAELAKVPKQGRELAPITVWWDGKGWTCIDGHHRIAAYRKAGKDFHDIPVEVFRGTLNEAVAQAAKGNTRDKLPMSAPEKTAAAWRLVVLGNYSKGQVVELAGVSDGTVANMRRVRTKLLDGDTERDLSKLSWNKARLEAAGQEEDIDWQSKTEEEAQAFANILAKHIGSRAHKRREAFIRGLEIFDAKLPEELIRHWREGIEEELEDEEE